MTTALTWTRSTDGRGYTGEPGNYYLHTPRYDDGGMKWCGVFQYVDGRKWPVEIGLAYSITKGKAIAERHAALGKAGVAP